MSAAAPAPQRVVLHVLTAPSGRTYLRSPDRGEVARLLTHLDLPTYWDRMRRGYAVDADDVPDVVAAAEHDRWLVRHGRCPR